MARVLMALPSRDFDPTEVATPWFRLAERGHEVRFATPDGRAAEADPLLLAGVLFGRLGATPEALARHARLIERPEYRSPLAYAAADPAAFDALVLPGGHAPGMRPYLESAELRAKALAFMAADKPVGAICHGVIVLARTLDPATGCSVLAGRRVTGLLKLLERSGYYLTAWKLGTYYRTYPAYVEDEIKASLSAPGDFVSGPWPTKPFALRDGNLHTARWPKDAEAFAASLLAALDERVAVRP